jgi:hypothetical protein
MRLPKIPRRSALEEARRDTDASLLRADRDLAKVTADLQEAQQLRAQIREHNLSNHFDSWLESVFYQRREAR